jgi:hypothetical protein
MSYIWNRTNKVPQELMPDRVTECFNEWHKEQKQLLGVVTSKLQQKKILNKIKMQTTNYENAISKYNA